MPTRSAFLALTLVAVLLGCGGGGDDDRSKAQVSGKVSKDGAGWDGTGFHIVFLPSDGTRPAHLDVGTDGTFKGEVNAGENKIILSVNMDAGGEGGHSAPEDLPKQYMSEDDTPWVQMINSGEELNLELDPAAMGDGGAGGGGGHGG